ncbi:Gp138 family membrane-puncturing spike protein [Dyadobacter psychrotolerans]|uniref:Phage protein Gp138 N-terminal domain-containing protein n=1 Tax=Dyadobacter psychrotolerans TaxID=2541721 RepID=A0A4R5DTD3_9BACT|nr:Gp138 family membrane-puncturing spike protein [Dyadobacter psychrotolerans]TDE17722.1 hypothetical protein E0F88_07475 [Dyadobacter psychrotolerans]
MHDINCVQIGIVEQFNAESQTATIQLALKHIISIAPDGTQTLKERPLLVQCPVMVLSGGAGHIGMPVSKGDTCIVLFNDREIDNWFTAGGVQAPSSDRTHDLSDGIAIVGIRNSQNAIAGYMNNSIEIRYGSTSLMVKGAGVVINKPLTSGIITAPAAVFANGATGTFSTVTVANGIVTGGTP